MNKKISDILVRFILTFFSKQLYNSQFYLIIITWQGIFFPNFLSKVIPDKVKFLKYKILTCILTVSQVSSLILLNAPDILSIMSEAITAS